MIKSAKRFVIKEKYTRSRYVIYFCNLTFELSARYAEVHNRAVAIQFARFLLLAFFRESDEDSRKNMYEKVGITILNILLRPIFNKISRFFYGIIVLEVDENFCNFFSSFY